MASLTIKTSEVLEFSCCVTLSSGQQSVSLGGCGIDWSVWPRKIMRLVCFCGKPKRIVAESFARERRLCILSSTRVKQIVLDRRANQVVSVQWLKSYD